jgi:hypothetical protein
MSIRAAFVSLAKLSASALNNAINNATPNITAKAGNTNRSASTTLSDDPDLTMTLGASGVFLVEFHIFYAATTAVGFKAAWTSPASSTGNRGVQGAASGAADVSGDGDNGRFGAHNFSSSIQYGTRNSAVNELYMIERGLVRTVGSGTCAFQWAPVVTGGAGATVFIDSWMSVVQVS